MLRVWLVVACSLVVSASQLAAEDEVKPYVSYEAAFHAASKHRASGEWKASEDALRQAIELSSDVRKHCDAHRVLVDVYSRLDKPGAMFDSADFVVANHPHAASASLTKSSLTSIVGQRDWHAKMKERYEGILVKDPKNRVALEMMERYTYLLSRQHDKRIEYLDRLIDLQKSSDEPIDIRMHMDRAFSYKILHDYPKSAELYEGTAELDDASRSFALMRAAEVWQQAKDKPKALAAAKRADQLGPSKGVDNNLYAWHRGLGEVFIYTRQTDLAIKHLEAAVAEAPINAYRQQCTELLELAKDLK
ncbi:tetratricopeptide repeat protein [Rubripirellula reticaptiva]|uniref:Tetratricopeptide repeat protein n=1 Tax=Rubripirellula reticaptiva TaxID=2528013 RepID=A0A5C6EP09_9BACT|nr:hypothetical protein [Rubripirellula reticaptiva]TWU49747.1 Tetratricopeptide repeat protein [Rubripirellula reticaptiva]